MRHFIVCLSAWLWISATASGQSAQYPPSDEAGKCFARVLTPAITQTVTEEILDEAASFRIEVEPAVYETSTVKVQVREEALRFRTIPAVFKTVEERVMIAPERTETIVVPAQFETYTETVVIEPERVTWKAGEGLYGRSAVLGRNAVAPGNEVHTGELLCRVIIPAKTRTITRSRMIAPPRTEERVIPPQYKTVSRQVIAEPAQVIEEIIPASFEERTVRTMVQPVRERRIEIPAVYRTVERQVVTGGNDLTWAEVLCETNTTRFKVAEIQGALTDAGYPTEIDGAFGQRTVRAMEAFQRDNGLSAGYLTVETVRALAIDPYARPPESVYAALRSGAV